MARKKRKIGKSVRYTRFEREVSRAKPQTTYRDIPYKYQTGLPVLSKRDKRTTLSRVVVRPKAEALPKRKIYIGVKPTTRVQTKTRPILSLSSPMACKQKKARARREYFGMRAAGKGGSRQNLLSKRFTVRC